MLAGMKTSNPLQLVRDNHCPVMLYYVNGLSGFLEIRLIEPLTHFDALIVDALSHPCLGQLALKITHDPAPVVFNLLLLEAKLVFHFLDSAIQELVCIL